MGFKNIFREYFTFNRRERNGVFVLLSIILLLILYLSFFDYFTANERMDFSKFEKDIAQFETELKRNSDSVSLKTTHSLTSSSLPDTRRVERFMFDPNNLPEKDWKRLGLSDKQIKIIKNYETKKGRFRSREDLKKMYCITPALYASLCPYIQISENEQVAVKNPAHSSLPNRWPSVHPPSLLVEINSADTIQLDKLKGIGFAYAKRIIRYRELLGGFVKKEQLLEVYGIDKEKYDAFSEAVFVNDSNVKKININTADFSTLKLHPYIKYNLASLIVNYRKQHGNYMSVEDIKHVGLMNDEIYTKLAPYLTTK